MNIKISVLTNASVATIEGISKEELLDPNYNTYRFAVSKNDLVNDYNRTEVTNKIKTMLDNRFKEDKRNTLFANDVENALSREIENYKANPEKYKHTNEVIVITQFPKL